MAVGGILGSCHGGPGNQVLERERERERCERGRQRMSRERDRDEGRE